VPKETIGQEGRDKLFTPGVLPLVGYTGRLPPPKGGPFVSSQYIKGRGKLPF